MYIYFPRSQNSTFCSFCLILSEKQELTFTSENSTITVVSWNCVEMGTDGGFCLLHIIWAWAQLESKQTSRKMAFPKTCCFGANEQGAE